MGSSIYNNFGLALLTAGTFTKMCSINRMWNILLRKSFTWKQETDPYQQQIAAQRIFLLDKT